MKKVTIHDVKQALLDKRFRDTLPESMHADVDKFLHNPGCGSCNKSIYRKIMQEAAPQLRKYFPKKEPQTLEELNQKYPNDWSVINCSIYNLVKHLKHLPPGKKQIDIARWQDQVTVVINELEVEDL